MSFTFDTMSAKMLSLSGIAVGSSNRLITEAVEHIRKTCTSVSLEHHQNLHSDHLSEVRDWCQDQFGDNWCYDWATFYFKHAEDAVIFSLKWS
jgi:hypothetical protein